MNQLGPIRKPGRSSNIDPSPNQTEPTDTRVDDQVSDVVSRIVTIVQINTNLLDTGLRVPPSPRHLHQGLDKEGCCAVYPDRDTHFICQDPAGCDDDAGVSFARHCETLEHKVGARNDQDQDGAELKHSVSKGLDQGLETEALRSSHRVSKDGCQTCDEDAREQDRDTAECECDGLPDDGNLIAV